MCHCHCQTTAVNVFVADVYCDDWTDRCNYHLLSEKYTDAFRTLCQYFHCQQFALAAAVSDLWCVEWDVNPLMSTLKPQSNGSLYSSTVIGTMAVDGWAVTFGTARRGWAGWSPAHPLLAVPNVAAHPSTASVPTSHYSLWHYNYLCTLNC